MRSRERGGINELMSRLRREDQRCSWQDGAEGRDWPESRPHHLKPPEWGGPEANMGYHRRGPNASDW